MGKFIIDNFEFFDGFFNGPVFNFDNSEFQSKIDYIINNDIRNISFDENISDFSFLNQMPFITEIYLSSNININDLYSLKHLKRIILNIQGKKPNIDFTKFPELEKLSIDWYNNFPNLSNNKNLTDLRIWKFKPKSKNFSELNLPENLESIQITETNIENFNGLQQIKLKKLEAYYCRNLVSLDGIPNTLETIIIENAPNLSFFDPLWKCLKMKKIILSQCGNIDSLKKINELKDLKLFTFFGTNIVDGDLNNLEKIDYVYFKNAKHYNFNMKYFDAKNALSKQK